MLSSWDDVVVAFDGDFERIKAKLLQERGDGGARRKRSPFSVEHDFSHFAVCTRPGAQRTSPSASVAPFPQC